MQVCETRAAGIHATTVPLPELRPVRLIEPSRSRFVRRAFGTCAAISHLMTLSAEALDILDYLNTASGRFVSLPEISRRAGGRQRFKASPGWAKMLLPSLLEAGLIEVNERGHCRSLSGAQSKEPAKPVAPAAAKRPSKIVGDNYFPTCELYGIVGGDYFPSGN